VPEKVEKKITKRDVDDDELHHNNCLRMVAIDSYRGGDYREDGGHITPTFWLGDTKVNVPPLIAHLVKKILVIRHFSGSLQNAYLDEELKGFCIIKIQFLFSFRGALTP